MEFHESLKGVGSFKKVLRIIQGSIMGAYRECQGCGKEVSISFKGISRLDVSGKFKLVFQGSFQEDSRKFQES